MRLRNRWDHALHGSVDARWWCRKTGAEYKQARAILAVRERVERTFSRLPSRLPWKFRSMSFVPLQCSSDGHEVAAFSQKKGIQYCRPSLEPSTIPQGITQRSTYNRQSAFVAAEETGEAWHRFQARGLASQTRMLLVSSLQMGCRSHKGQGSPHKWQMPAFRR